MTQNDITPLILAGGKGTRLRSVLPDYPKILVEVAGRPFITYLLDQLVESGFRKVILCTGYKAKTVEKKLGDKYKSMDISYSSEEKPLGTAGAVRKAMGLVRSELILVLNGDSYLDFKLSDFINRYLGDKIDFAIVLTEAEDTSRFGRVDIDENSKVKSFNEKGVSGKGHINAGIYLLKSDFMNTIPAGGFVSFEKDIFPGLADKSGIAAYPVASDFIDIGTPESFHSAETFFKRMGKNS